MIKKREKKKEAPALLETILVVSFVTSERLPKRVLQGSKSALKAGTKI